MDDIVMTVFIALVMGAVLTMIGTFMGLEIVDRYRKKKHPVWFEHYNRATNNSFTLGRRLKDKTDVINKFISSQQEAFRDGKWTEEDYRQIMRYCTDEYIQAVNQYQTDFVALGIDEDLKTADAYAKEHNWKWGILYNDKETGQESKGYSISP